MFERIASADDDVPHLGVRAQIRERRRERLERHGAAAVADHPRAGAEAAVDGAAIGREEQRAIGVPLHEMRRDLVRDLAERVDEVPLHDDPPRARPARTAGGSGTSGRRDRTSER